MNLIRNFSAFYIKQSAVVTLVPERIRITSLSMENWTEFIEKNTKIIPITSIIVFACQTLVICFRPVRI